MNAHDTIIDALAASTYVHTLELEHRAGHASTRDLAIQTWRAQKAEEKAEPLNPAGGHARAARKHAARLRQLQRR